MAESLDPVVVTATSLEGGEPFSLASGSAPGVSQAQFVAIAHQQSLRQQALAGAGGGSEPTYASGAGGEGYWPMNGNGNGAYFFDDTYGATVADPTYFADELGLGSVPYPGGEIGIDPQPTYPVVENPPASDWVDWTGFLNKLGRSFGAATRPPSFGSPGGAQAQRQGLAPSQAMMSSLGRMVPSVPGITLTGVTMRAAMAGLLRNISARIGQRVTAANVASLVKRIGIDATALALGITGAEVLQLYLMGTMKRRRRRGITGRQIATARSTIRRMTGFMRQVQEACSPAMRGSGRARRHRAGCTCVACR